MITLIPERGVSSWIIDQMRLQPYQHVLEIGVGTGRLLEETARALRIGFLAGVESSPALYQQAYRRNRSFITRQLMQLHLGELADLPYPPHYFHIVYSTSAILPGKDRVVELLRLTRLLRSGGRLVLLFRPGAAPQIQQDYISAGLERIQMEYREGPFGTSLVATGLTA